MNNKPVELTQEEILAVSGAGLVADGVRIIGDDIVNRLEGIVLNFSAKTQASLNNRGWTYIASLVKVIV